LTTSPQRQIGTSLSSRGNCGNSVRSSWRRGKCVSKSASVSMPSRRSARSFGRGIQLSSSSDCEIATLLGNGFGNADDPGSVICERLYNFALFTVHKRGVQLAALPRSAWQPEFRRHTRRRESEMRCPTASAAVDSSRRQKKLRGDGACPDADER